MTPTQRLRFVERQHGYKSVYGNDTTPNMVRILQQWWEDNSTDVHWIDGKPGEWRDVPLENEK
jgi:hypothetical protein